MEMADQAAAAAASPPTLMWKRPVMNGAGPAARGGHSASLVGNLLIVFGGHYYAGDSTCMPLSVVVNAHVKCLIV